MPLTTVIFEKSKCSLGVLLVGVMMFFSKTNQWIWIKF